MAALTMVTGRQTTSIHFIFIIAAAIRGATAFSGARTTTSNCPHFMHPNPSRVSLWRHVSLSSSSHHSRRQPHTNNFPSHQVKSMHQSNDKMTSSTRLNSHNSPSTSNGNKNDICIRILCLHGKGGNGEQFVNSSLMPLRSLLEKRLAADRTDKERNLSFHWESLTAPYVIGDGKGGGYSWWTMPPGVRSYNAKEYDGFEKSDAMVMDKIFPTKTNGPNKIDAASRNFDIILGHSQGAILTAALFSTHDKLWNNSSDSSPLGYILNGAAWPNPYKKWLKSLAPKRFETKSNGSSLLLPRMLFIMGNEDTINPIESAMQVHDACDAAQFDVSIVNHDGGHSVPIGRDEDSVRALEEVADWILCLAKEKSIQVGK